jgi:mRNA interferase MazF
VTQAPDKGDFAHLDFDPQAGHEQKGKRFALVLSPRAFHEKCGLAFVAPITTHSKGYPFEVAIHPGLRRRGVVLADQMRGIDWRARDLVVTDRAPEALMDEVLARIAAILGMRL